MVIQVHDDTTGQLETAEYRRLSARQSLLEEKFDSLLEKVPPKSSSSTAPHDFVANEAILTDTFVANDAIAPEKSTSAPEQAVEVPKLPEASSRVSLLINLANQHDDFDDLVHENGDHENVASPPLRTHTQYI